MGVLFESVRVALEALFANKLRSLLTMLGIIIGVASVIVMVAIIQGARQKVIEQFTKIGTNLIFVAYQPHGDIIRGGWQGLRMGDVDAIQSQCTMIGPVSATANSNGLLSAGTNYVSGTMVGVTANYVLTQNIDLAEGRFIDQDDNKNWSKACVLGAKLADKLFPDGHPIGQSVTYENTLLFVVVGVLAPKDRGPFSGDVDNTAYVALSSLQKRVTGTDQLDSITTKSRTISQTNEAADEVWAVIRGKHPLTSGDYVVDTQDGLLRQVNQVFMTFQMVLGGVGGLCLLTGGIGVMNIMLVSVTERTREIGIRKAVGATRSAILWQFLIEAMVVSGFGGLIGIATGYGLASIVHAVAKKLLPIFIPFWAVALGFGFAVGVGLFFGIYPAYRAARLDPIVALRNE